MVNNDMTPLRPQAPKADFWVLCSFPIPLAAAIATYCFEVMALILAPLVLVPFAIHDLSAWAHECSTEVDCF